MAGGFELADLFPSSKLLSVLCWNKYRLLRMRRRVDRILDRIVEEHRANKGGDDIVDVLIRMQENRELHFPITDHNIKAIIFVSPLYLSPLHNLFRQRVNIAF